MKEREQPASVAEIGAVEPRGVDSQPGADGRESLERTPRSEAVTNGTIRKKRPPAKSAGVTPHTRYFLTRSGGDGIPELEKEVGSENEAMIAALKQDRTFVSVTEWRAKIDPDQEALVIEKEPVRKSET
jgi:hypothetical protein